MKQRFSVRLAVATHLNEDVAGIEDERRYQPTRTPCPIYTVGNDYFTATGKNRRPQNVGGWNWVRVRSRATEMYGWNIWKAKD